MSWFDVMCRYVFIFGGWVIAFLFSLGEIASKKEERLYKREQILMQMGVSLIHLSENGVSTKDYSFHANPKTIKKYSFEDVAGVTPDDSIKEGFVILLYDKTGGNNECAD